MNPVRIALQRNALKKWRRLRTGSLEREFVDRVHDYWRLQSGDALQAAIALLDLPEVNESGHAQPARLPIAVLLDGWVDPAHRDLLSTAGLRRTNPGGQFWVHLREKRSDVKTALGRPYKRSGFSLEAYLPEVPSRMFDLAGTPAWQIRGSTHPAQQFLATVLPGIDDFPTSGVAALTVDKVRMFDISVTDPLGRLALLAPEELTLAIRASGASDLALQLAKRFGEVPSLSEWCDRWAFIGGSDLAAHPDRRTLHIRRVAAGDWNRPAEPSIGFPVMQPGPGRLVHAVPGPAPILNYPFETATVEDCWVQNGGTVYTDTDLILLDRMADPRHERGDEVYIDIYGAATRGDSALLLQTPDSGMTIDEAIFIGGRHDFNWYHWIIEYLPRLLDIDGEVDADVPVLISSRVPDNGLRALHSLTSREVRRLPAGARARVKRLHMASPAMGVPDNYLARWQRIMHADTASLLRFREAILAAAGRDRGKAPDKVFLKRTTSHRKLENQDALSKLAESRGYVTVALEKLGFFEQVALFSGARHVVGGSGAAMANYIFSGPQTRVLDLVSRHNIDSPLPALICAVSGADFAYLYGDPERPLNECRSLHEARHSDFRVEPGDLARQLEP